MGDPVGAARHVREALAPDGTWMIVEPARRRPRRGQPQPGRPGVLRLLDAAVRAERRCPRPVGYALGAQAGEAAIREVVDRRRLHPVRRVAAETPFNIVYEARPVTRSSAPGPGHAAVPGARDRPGGGSAPCVPPGTVEAGTVERDGVRIAYEVYGDGEPTVVFCPHRTRSSTSRPGRRRCRYLAPARRVVTVDGRGATGASDRPADPAAYANGE